MSRWILSAISLATAFVATIQAASGHDPIASPLGKGAARRRIYFPIRDFTLIDQDGKAFQFRSLRGKVVLASFIYTTCPDICPLVTTGMRLVQEGLTPSERRSVFLLSITTDPEVDTPEVLRSYAARYKIDFSNWSLVTGGLRSLTPVWKNFGVQVERKARGLVNHTSLTALVDQKGALRFAYHGSSPDPKVILRDLRGLLDKRASP